MRESQLFQRYASRLVTIMDEKANTNDLETAMAAISAYCNLAYEWNQFYLEEHLEQTVIKISDLTYEHKRDKVFVPSQYVLFYDGFGSDTRGLALIYIDALIKLGYSVVYVTTETARDVQPELMKVLEKGQCNVRYIQTESSFCIHIAELDKVFQDFCPKMSFFYTTPDDVAAAVVFYHYKDKVTRFQINLTDHTFWLGKCAFDVCIEFREYGLKVSYYHRKIDISQLRILPIYPWINEDIAFEGFGFLTEGKKIVFSGGALYKTLGGENKFYKMADRLLADNEDLLFVYAGDGDDSELNKLEKKWPHKVYHIAERKDLFALMHHIDVYLSTYPISGGLMSQYAAAAGKIPVTLNDENDPDTDGMLRNQEQLHIEFPSLESAAAEINHLLRDDAYRKQRGEQIKYGVIDKKEFCDCLKDILEGKAQTIQIPEYINTEKFREKYKNRFKQRTVVNSIVRKKQKRLWKYFFCLFMQKAVYKARGN